ncbi:MAG: flagellin, partial [Candidatus Riflebacteria bacterium]|nr:flagellin [Candidatus Riflebacteria bacterium]
SINARIEAVGVDGLSATVADGEIRLSYEPPTSTNTSTIEISAALADQLGIMDQLANGFVQGDKDESKAVTGFSTYHTAGGTAVTFDLTDAEGDTVSIAAYTTEADREVADMVEIEAFEATVNSQLDVADVNARMDAVNGSLAFTSTRLGQENVSGADPIQSRITLLVNEQDALDKFGLTNGTAKGSGDTNFKLHVVDNKPQFQIGADAGQSMQISMGDMSSKALGIDKLDMTSVEGAQTALSKLNKALDTVSAERSKLGAFQNRLEYSISNLQNTSSNLTSAESRIRDADIAMEMIEFTRNQIVSQSGTAMLAQANMVPQSVLSLLGQ